MKVRRNNVKCLWPLLVHGLISFLGIGLLHFHSTITDLIFDKVLVLTPTSNIIKEWLSPSSPITVELYFFNWTNPEDFKNTSVKPKFSEMGPYVYNEQYWKVNVTYNDNNTITHRNQKFFYFDEKKSHGTLDDNITTLNIIPIVAVDKARNWNFFLRKGLSIALNGVPYDISRTVREFIFDGYKDPFLSSAKYLPFLDNIPDMDKFAWFYKRNGSIDYEGVYNMGTGLGNTTLGTIYNWNHESKGPYPGSCSKLGASCGEIFGQRITKDKLQFFFSDFCRIVTMQYNETLTWNGIEAYKFTGGISFLDSGTYFPENECLCTKKCQKYGVVDYSPCKFGIPAYLSFPHFLKADPSFRNQVDGMMPDERKHEVKMLINPRTGIVLDITISIQFNLLVEPNEGISKYRDVPHVMFPMFWFIVKTSLVESYVIQLRLLLWMPVIFKCISAIMILLGIVLFILTLRAHLISSKQKKNKIYEGRFSEQLKPLDEKVFYDRA